MDKQTIGAVRFLLGENKGRYPHCNSLYVEGAGILIDPASNRERLIRLRAERDVKAVWLSHWHEDHFMQLDLFDDLPLWISPVDAPPLADMETFLQWYGFTEEERTSGDRSWSTSFISGRRPAGHLVGGERITVGPVTIDLIATRSYPRPPGLLLPGMHPPVRRRLRPDAVRALVRRPLFKHRANALLHRSAAGDARVGRFNGA